MRYRRFVCEEPSTQGLSHEAECQPDVCPDTILRALPPGSTLPIGTHNGYPPDTIHPLAKPIDCVLFVVRYIKKICSYTAFG